MWNPVVKKYWPANYKVELTVKIYNVGLRIQHQSSLGECRYCCTHQNTSQALATMLQLRANPRNSTIVFLYRNTEARNNFRAIH